MFLAASQLLLHKPPVRPELRGEASKRRRAFACGRAQLRHHSRVFIQDEPHRDRVHRVDAAAVAVVELCRESLDALQLNLMQVLREIGRRYVAVRTCVAQDSSQLREPSRGVVHRA
ncbi:MAG TPA: hypothetical protein VFO21_00030 [Vicinamibacterales bacterium]|nr:hypothetical protein [Vicinamibacterales bacterium]